jgi:hypothetical protein
VAVSELCTSAFARLSLGIDDDFQRLATCPSVCIEWIDVDAPGLRIAWAEALAAHMGADFNFGQLAVGGVERFACFCCRAGLAGTARLIKLDVPDDPSQVGR